MFDAELVYWMSLWRIIRGHRVNRVIERGSITLMLLFLIMFLPKVPNLPDWVVPSLGLLLFLLCLLTMLSFPARTRQKDRHSKALSVSGPVWSVPLSTSRRD